MFHGYLGALNSKYKYHFDLNLKLRQGYVHHFYNLDL